MPYATFAQFRKSAPNMSYDTTVHEALDPPQSRVADRDAVQTVRSTILRRAMSFWRPLAATSATIGTFFLVTWIVATLTTSANDKQSDTDQEFGAAQLQNVLQDGGE